MIPHSYIQWDFNHNIIFIAYAWSMCRLHDKVNKPCIYISIKTHIIYIYILPRNTDSWDCTAGVMIHPLRTHCHFNTLTNLRDKGIQSSLNGLCFNLQVLQQVFLQVWVSRSPPVSLQRFCHYYYETPPQAAILFEILRNVKNNPRARGGAGGYFIIYRCVVMLK